MSVGKDFETNGKGEILFFVAREIYQPGQIYYKIIPRNYYFCNICVIFF